MSKVDSICRVLDREMTIGYVFGTVFEEEEEEEPFWPSSLSSSLNL